MQGPLAAGVRTHQRSQHRRQKTVHNDEPDMATSIPLKQPAVLKACSMDLEKLRASMSEFHVLEKTGIVSRQTNCLLLEFTMVIAPTHGSETRLLLETMWRLPTVEFGDHTWPVTSTIHSGFVFQVQSCRCFHALTLWRDTTKSRCIRKTSKKWLSSCHLVCLSIYSCPFGW